MKKNIKVNLSTKSISELIAKLNATKVKMNKVGNEIVDELADLGIKELKALYDTTAYVDESRDETFFKDIDGNKGSFGVMGSAVLYIEFGTGSIGDSAPHPLKYKYNLNPYNYGKKIITAKGNGKYAAGEKFWVYYGSGGKVFTQGIPAGLQMYNTAMYLRNISKNVAKKKVGDVLSTI